MMAQNPPTMRLEMATTAEGNKECRKFMRRLEWENETRKGRGESRALSRFQIRAPRSRAGQRAICTHPR